MPDYTVLTSRQYSLSYDEQLPAIIIYTPDEPAEYRGMGTKDYIRNLELRIELTISGTNDVDDDMDEILGEIEGIMSNNPKLGGIVLSTTLLHTQTDIGVDGEAKLGIGTLIYECKYVS